MKKRNRKKKRADTVIAELQAQLNISLSPSRPCGTTRISPYPKYALRARVAPAKGPWNSRPSPRPSPPTGRAKLLCRDREEACTPCRLRDGSRATREWIRGKAKECEYVSVGSGVLPRRREKGRADDAVSEAAAAVAAGGSSGRNASKVSSLLVPARPSGSRRGDPAHAGGSYVAADPPAVLDDATAAEGYHQQLSTGGRKRRRNSSKGVISGNSSSRGDSMSVGRWSGTDHGEDHEKDKHGEADSTAELPPPDHSDISSADVWSLLDNYVHRRAEVAKANRHVRAIEAMRRVRGGEGPSRFADDSGC